MPQDVPASQAHWESFTPQGLRVLVVDDDKLCLKMIAKMLQQCNYEVITCGSSSAALSLLRDEKNHFDLVLSDVVMPDIDGFKLLEIIGLEMDIPVIMMSYDGDTNTVLQGVTHGAVDFLIKPVRYEELRNMWQHVVRKRKQQAAEPEGPGAEPGMLKRRNSTSSGDMMGVEARGAAAPEANKRRAPEEGDEQPMQQQNSKRPRVHWSSEMHTQFVAAVNKLGIDKAVPKKILELMTVDGLTRENVASHLQKYRLYLKKASKMDVGGPPPHSQAGLLQPANGMPQQDAQFAGFMGPAPSMMLQSMPAMQPMAQPQMAGMYAASMPAPAMHSGYMAMPKPGMPGGAGWQGPMMAPIATGTPQSMAYPHHHYSPMMGQPMGQAAALPMGAAAVGMQYQAPMMHTSGSHPHLQQHMPQSTLPPLAGEHGRAGEQLGPVAQAVKRESFDTMGGISGLSGLSGGAPDDMAGIADIGQLPEEMEEFLSYLTKDAPLET